MSAVAEYREVLTGHSPEDAARLELRAAVKEDLDEGVDRAQVLAALDYLRRKARGEGREDHENAFMDVMDYVVGWCNPRMAL